MGNHALGFIKGGATDRNAVAELDAFLNVRAARGIVRYRDRHGAFEEIRELFQVSRFGPYSLGALRREAQTFEGIEED